MHADFELANLINSVRVFVAVLLAAINPRARILADKIDRIGQGRPRDTGIDRGMKNLGHCAHRRWAVKSGMVINNIKSVDCDMLENSRAAGCSALAEAGPVVDDGHARSIALDKDDGDAAPVVLGDNGHPVGKHRAGGIELFTVQNIGIAFGREPRLEVKDRFGANLDKGIPKTIALQHPLKKELLLLLSPIQTEGFNHIVMVLWNLA